MPPPTSIPRGPNGAPSKAPASPPPAAAGIMRRIGLFGYAGVWAWAIVATTAIRAQSTLKNSRGEKFFMISFYYEIFGRKFFAEFDDEIFFSLYKIITPTKRRVKYGKPPIYGCSPIIE
jgi:hypothetical protein